MLDAPRLTNPPGVDWGHNKHYYAARHRHSNDRPNKFSRTIQGVVKKGVFQLTDRVEGRKIYQNLQKNSEMKLLEFVGKLPVNG